MIALFGGAFDPIHSAHIKTIRYLSKKYIVWVAPCANHPFNKNMAPLKHRINMCKLVTNATIKIFNEKYTIDTLKNISKCVHLVIGQDNANIVEKWHKGEEIINKFPFIIVARKGCDILRGWYLFPPHRFLNINLPKISSTEIREKISQGLEPKFVDKKVLNYIKKNRLYQ
jgi:nicotinate (nicotinamide) nucleotide adenylyltransferase